VKREVLAPRLRPPLVVVLVTALASAIGVPVGNIVRSYVSRVPSAPMRNLEIDDGRGNSTLTINSATREMIFDSRFSSTVTLVGGRGL
jgi:hypothetical protein